MSYTAAVTNFSVDKSTYIPMDGIASHWKIGRQYTIACKWDTFREQLLKQWTRLDASEVDDAGPVRTNIAQLIHNRYGISLKMVENYLRNFERMMPLA